MEISPEADAKTEITAQEAAKKPKRREGEIVCACACARACVYVSMCLSVYVRVCVCVRESTQEVDWIEKHRMRFTPPPHSKMHAHI